MGAMKRGAGSGSGVAHAGGLALCPGVNPGPGASGLKMSSLGCAGGACSSAATAGNARSHDENMVTAKLMDGEARIVRHSGRQARL